MFVHSYGLAIVLFTVLTKVLLFPLSLLAQRNSIKMVRMQPALADIRTRNTGNGELIMAETKALYKQERYSTVLGVVPLLMQVPLVLGLIDVVYNPLQHLMHIDEASIRILVQHTAALLDTTVRDLGYAGQLRTLDLVHSNPAGFSGQFGISAAHLDQIQAMDIGFLGINLASVPRLNEPTVLVPVLSAASALGLCVVQNRHNVLQVEAGFVSRWGMAIFLTAFSGYFALVLPCGLGLYWIAGNLLSIPVLVLCNLVYNPRHYIDYESRAAREKPTREEQRAAVERKRELARREKADAHRFFAKGLKKNIVVYSEGSGYWKYFAKIIGYVVENSEIDIHYVTSDPDDRIFRLGNPRVIPYYIGPRALVAFMMKMDADIVLMTTPDLETFQIKRSLVRKDIEYIYLDHGMTSYHLMLRKNALDNFDTIFVYGPNHIQEVRETERLYGLPPKTLVKTGYGLLDDLLTRVEWLGPRVDLREQILIAPSWQAGNLMERGIDELLAQLLGRGYRVIIRPHPEYAKRFPERLAALKERYARHLRTDAFGGILIVEEDFSSNKTVYQSDIVVTDWSSIAQEFSYTTKRPSLFINTPMKVMNPEYDLIPLVPLDISLRDEIGVSLDLDELDQVSGVITNMLVHSQKYADYITEVLERNIYDVGNAAQSGGDYLIARVKEIEYVRSLGFGLSVLEPPARRSFKRGRSPLTTLRAAGRAEGIAK
jgi:YidC/Oxa1 family membrane protein insertase